MTLALAALAIGLPAALFVLWPLFRRDRGAGATVLDTTRAELEAEKLRALRAIRELELDHQAGHLAAHDYAELRARAELRAAAILRRLDELGPERPERAAGRRPAASPVAAAVPVPWSRRPLVLTGGASGLVLFGVVLGALVVRFTAPAPPDSRAGPMAAIPDMPGMSRSPAPGGPPAASGPGGDASRPIPPGMLQGMLQAARSSLQAGRMQDAIAAYQAILRREPNNVDALTHFGLILAMAGHADRSLEFFDRALARDPDYPEALSYSAQVRYELRQDYAGAIAAWERFAKVVPDQAARDQALERIREARAKLAAAPPAPTAPAPGSAAPPAGSAPPPKGGDPAR